MGYSQKIIKIKRNAKLAHEFMPPMRRVAAPLKRWILGPHQGSVSDKHLDYYLDEFTFRFNHRHSRARGARFSRLVLQTRRRPRALSPDRRPGTPKAAATRGKWIPLSCLIAFGGARRKGVHRQPRNAGRFVSRASWAPACVSWRFISDVAQIRCTAGGPARRRFRDDSAHPAGIPDAINAPNATSLAHRFCRGATR